LNAEAAEDAQRPRRAARKQESKSCERSAIHSRGASGGSRGRATSAPLLNDAEIFHPIAERLVSHCDAILRIGGPSAGADEMVKLAEAQGRAVYRRLEDVPGCS